MSTLDELAIKYGTDKSSLNHNYTTFYEKHLPKEPKRILEIGVKDGASVMMWREYFPNAEIFGLDLFVETSESAVFDKMIANNLGIINVNLWAGNQCDYQVLEQLRKYDFDVIIDDGSHNSRDQMMTFFGLFNGKHYFIEDLHCNGDEYYSQGLPNDFRAYELFNGLLELQELNDFRSSQYTDFDKERKIVYIRDL